MKKIYALIALLHAALPAFGASLERWKSFSSDLKAEEVKVARSFFEEYLEGKRKAEESKELNDGERAALASIAVTTFLDKDFFKKHQNYKPGSMLRLLNACAGQYDSEIKEKMEKHSGISAEKFISAAHSGQKLATSPDLSNSMLLPLYTSHTGFPFLLDIFSIAPNPTTLIDVLPASLNPIRLTVSALALLLPKFFRATLGGDTVNAFESRGIREPKLKVQTAESERKFLKELKQSCKIAGVDPDRIFVVGENGNELTHQAFSTTELQLQAKKRQILVPTLNGKLFERFSKEEVGALLRLWKNRSKRSISLRAISVSALLIGLAVAAVSAKQDIVLLLALYLALFLTFEFVIVPLLADVAFKTVDSATTFADKNFEEIGGRKLLATAEEKVLVMQRFRLPITLLSSVHKELSRQTDDLSELILEEKLLGRKKQRKAGK